MKKAILVLALVVSAFSATSAMAWYYPNYATSLNYCAAQTFCPQSGRNVSCYVYADAYRGIYCTQEWAFGYGVRCTGYDVFGNWVVYGVSCP
jgi:hypothetical protein